MAALEKGPSGELGLPCQLMGGPQRQAKPSSPMGMSWVRSAQKITAPFIVSKVDTQGGKLTLGNLKQLWLLTEKEDFEEVY